MSLEVESQITGKLVKNSVNIPNKLMQNALLSKGYGEKYEKACFRYGFDCRKK